MSDEVSSFDPFSSSSTTASSMILLAISCIIFASRQLGVNGREKQSGGFRIGMAVIASGIFMFMGGLYIFWAYD